MKEGVIPHAWLVERLTSDDYRTACRTDFRAAGFDESQIEKLLAKINDEAQDRWRRFLAEKKDGDELWRYRSSEESWASFSGCAGFAVVRLGVPVATMNTMRS